jgi:isopentenyl-diphosphate Delta-isomerase
MESPESMSARKSDHIRICETYVDPIFKGEYSAFGFSAHAASSGVGNLNDVFTKKSDSWRHFDDIVLPHTALPKFAPRQVNLKARMFDKSFAAPFLITGMTGGVERGEQINENLARLAVEKNIPMGLGSQRMMMLDSKFTPLFTVKKKFPELFLIGNVGAVSLCKLKKKRAGLLTSEDINRTIETCKLNAFAIHLNALQECVQPEGEHEFETVLENLHEIVPQISVPVIIKEVGAGMCFSDIQNLLELPIAGIDVGGTGGTSWSFVEGQRMGEHTTTRRLGNLFQNTGIPTVQGLKNALLQGKELSDKNISIVATGGVRNGVHVAKALALGANFSGIGLPFFKAALAENALELLNAEFNFFEQSLRVAMVCAGVESVDGLRNLSGENVTWK